MNIFRAVNDFNKKFKIKWHKTPRSLPPYLQVYREDFLQEELDEFKMANSNGDLEGQLDAMIDLIYVAAGTLNLMGFSVQQQTEAFRRVHFANMSKVRARSARESKRHHAFDVIKPKNWKAPDLKDLCR